MASNKKPVQTLVNALGAMAIERNVHRHKKFRGLIGFAGTWSSDIESKWSGLQERMESWAAFRSVDAKRLRRTTDEDSHRGAFSSYGRHIFRTSLKDWGLLTEILTSEEPDSALTQFISNRGGKVHGLGLAAFSETAHLFRPNLYAVLNNRVELPGVSGWLPSSGYPRYVSLCTHLRSWCDSEKIDSRARFIELDRRLYIDPKTRKPLRGRSRLHRDTIRSLCAWLETARESRDEDGLDASKEPIDWTITTDGERNLRTHHVAERNMTQSQKQKLRASRENTCEVCGIAPSDLPAELSVILQIHHIVPVSKGPQRISAETLKLLCPNCHSAAHRWIEARSTKSPTRAKWLRIYADFERSARKRFSNRTMCMKSSQ